MTVAAAKQILEKLQSARDLPTVPAVLLPLLRYMEQPALQRRSRVCPNFALASIIFGSAMFLIASSCGRFRKKQVSPIVISLSKLAISA